MKYLTLLPLFYLAFPSPLCAQVVSDNTVSTTVNPLENNTFEITGGRQAATNLFHSFEQLSVPKNGTVHFLNRDTIKNIITRVTGELPSEIQGLIRTEGTANFILLNPNGITFGENAMLEVGGSFMATTAEKITFADGVVYSTTDATPTPLLTVTTPIGLGFGSHPGEIINYAGRLVGAFETPTDSLTVPIGETLALVGGKITFDEGLITAPGGRVEVGAVAGNDTVRITETESGWELNYDQTQVFANIDLFNDSLLSSGDPDENPTNRPTPSSLQLQGKNITLENNVDMGTDTFDAVSSELMLIRGTESITLKTGVGIFNTAFLSTGDSGTILIETPTLQILDSSRITATSVEAEGQGGNIIINTEDSVQIDNLSVISTETFGIGPSLLNGDGGDISLNTRHLQITNGGRIVSSIREGSNGDGGTININATESIRIDGSAVNNLTGETQLSRIASEARTRPLASGEAVLTTGDAGEVTVSSNSLSLTQGGQLSVAVIRQAQGEAGRLTVNVDRITINDDNSGIFASSVSPLDAGDLNIDTNSLIIAQQGEISVTATGTGNAGNLRINADFLQLQTGEISANTQAGEGNIVLTTEDLRLRNNSTIETLAFGVADGGNITIDTNTLTLLENSEIKANAQQGLGGRVVVNTQGIFLSPDSSITATSEQGEAFNGVVEINTPDNQTTQSVVIKEQPSANPQVYEQCITSDELSRFIVSGRGGIRSTPQDFRADSTVQEDLALPTSTVEAQGWMMNEQGDTVLTVQSPFAFHSPCFSTHK